MTSENLLSKQKIVIPFFLIWIRIKLFLDFLLTDLEAAVAYSSDDSDKSEVSELVDKGAVWFTFSFHSATT